MRERQPGDVLYNVRCDGYDPRQSVHVEPSDVELSKEPALMLVSWRTIRRFDGTVAQRLAAIIMDLAPATEHALMKFTSRPEVIADFPSNTPTTWHTDFAHGNTDVARRQAVHSYVLITAEPRTAFIRESSVWLPDARTALPTKFSSTLTQAGCTPFLVEPWTLVKFNATELHTATEWNGAPSSRLFFRATYDPLR